MISPLVNRALLSSAERIVVKVGSSSLTARDGGLNMHQLEELIDVLSGAVERGQETVLVSSGAIAAGLAPLGFTRRPKGVQDQQAAAMVGQQRLMAAYSDGFARRDITIGQVLLTQDDVVNRKHYANAQAALTRLLHYGVVPIVNENDAVVTDDLRFGDNDRVAALVAHLVNANALILCTDVDGLYTAPPHHPDARLISEVNRVEDLEGLTISGKGSEVGTGGMRTKVAAADIATRAGVGVLLANTADLRRALTGEVVGTWFTPRGHRVNSRELWLRYSAMSHGTITVDDGAAAALRKGGASLLAVGIDAVDGSFAAGDLVQIVDRAGIEVARGLCAFSDVEVRRFVDPEQDERAPRPIVHRDDMAPMREP